MNIINVSIRNNLRTVPVTVEDTSTLRFALEKAGVEYSDGVLSLDGATLRPGDLDKTFHDFGITDHCYLMKVVKADNA